MVSPLLVAELDGVPGRERVGARLNAGALGRLGCVLAEAPLVEDPAVEAVSRDPTDDYLIALARASASDCIISGDTGPGESGRTQPSRAHPYAGDGPSPLRASGLDPP